MEFQSYGLHVEINRVQQAIAFKVYSSLQKWVTTLSSPF